MLPRLLHLHPATRRHLTRLSKEAERDGAYRVAKRLQAVVLNAEGRTSGELAAVLKAPRSKVSEWLAQYQAHGIDGLLEGYRSGRPPELAEAQRRQLGDILDSGPVAYGLDNGVWTSPMIAWVIEEEFGVTYHPGHVRKLLHTLDFSVQRPRRVLARANPAEQDRWHRRTYPEMGPQGNSWVSRQDYGHKTRARPPMVRLGGCCRSEYVITASTGVSATDSRRGKEGKKRRRRRFFPLRLPQSETRVRVANPN
jgi:transposase